MSDLNAILLGVNIILAIVFVISFFIVGIEDDKESK